MPDNPITAALQALQPIAQNAAKPEKSEPGPGDVGPTVETKDNNLITLPPLPPEEVQKFWDRVNRSDARIKARAVKWDILLREYLPIVMASGEAETVKAQKHFRNLHSKIGQLFYRSPDLVLMPKDPSPSQNQQPNPMQAQLPPGSAPLPPLTMEDIIAVKQAVLEAKLGRDGIKISRLMDELLFDVLGWTGIGCSKLGYRCVTKQVQQPKMAPPAAVPMMGQPPPQPQPMMGPDGQPVMETVPVPIFEEWYDRRFSPKKLITNDDLYSTRHDEDATLMGMHFYMAPEKAKAIFKLTDAEMGKAVEDDKRYLYPEDKEGGDKNPNQLVHGVELWVKASVYTDELHPQAINQLVLIEGINDKAFVWRPSPDQQFDAQGKLTEDSLIGFPIRVLTIRDLADSAFPPSDSAFTNSMVKQLSTWMRQSVQIRDAAIGKYLFDMGVFDQEEIDILKNGEIGAYIGVEAGKLAQGKDSCIISTAQVHSTPDDARAIQLFSHNIDETLGVTPGSAGAMEQTVRSATEVHNSSQGMSARNGKELSRVVDFYLDTARMIDQLLMRYADQNEYVHIAGENGAKRMMMWNNQMISGKYLYDIAPDSQMQIDTAQDFQMASNFYNLAAKDSLFNREYVLRRMARMRGWDPMKVVKPQAALPQPQPEKPKVSLTLNGDDLKNPEVILLLEQLGLFEKPKGPAPGAQPEHGGTNTAGEAISQHHASNSGGQPGAPGAVDHRAAQVK